MDLTLILTGVGLVIALVIGLWQILLARKQVKHAEMQVNAKNDASEQLRIAIASIKWKNSANLFWLTHDLMLAHYTLLMNEPKTEIMFALKQSYHHWTQLGAANLSQITAGKQLAQLIEWVEPLSDEGLTQAKRENYAQGIAQIIRAIGSLAEMNQPDFVAYAEGNAPSQF